MKRVTPTEARVLKYFVDGLRGNVNFAPSRQQASEACHVTFSNLSTHLTNLIHKELLVPRDRLSRYGMYYQPTQLGRYVAKHLDKYIKVKNGPVQTVRNEPTKTERAQAKYHTKMLNSPRNYAGPKPKGVAM